MDSVIQLKNVSVEYRMKLFNLRAVDDVTLDIPREGITALVGESGSGKTTLASTILNCLVEPGVLAGGDVIYIPREGESIAVNRLEGENLRKFRWSEISMVFQGAQSSLNPLNTVYAQFRETYLAHRPHTPREEIKKKCREVLDIVNLDADRVLKMYPHELSGGMKQRIMIAFSLLLDAKFIILDEPTTALDVITQNYVFSILKRINREMRVTMLLLTHDMGIVAKYSDYIGVMYAGRLMEFGKTPEVFKKRLHPYTSQLISATPSLHLPVSTVKSIDGNPPDMLNLPEGCPFAPRCLKKTDICGECCPGVSEPFEGHTVRCHLYKEMP